MAASNIINFLDFNTAEKQSINESLDESQSDYGSTRTAYGSYQSDPSFSGFVSAINSVLKDDRLTEIPIPDGKIHRFGSKKNCWYILFQNLNGVAVGEYGSWKDGIESKWTNYQAKDTSLDFQYQQLLDQVRYQREEERIKAQTEAKNKAKADYEKADAFDDSMTHPYLEKKQIKPVGDIRLKSGRLLLPMVRDMGGDDPEIVSYQTIAANGDKLFLYGGEKKGTYFVIPASEEIEAKGVVIVEGYATGASINLATGLPVIVAFDAGNLPIVAKAIRQKEPNLHIILAGDNDANSRGQEAVDEAFNALERLNGGTPNATKAIPHNIGMDWNDVHVKEGLEKVRDGILNIIEGKDDCQNAFYPCPNILDWNSVDRFSGKAPERKMLISETIPMGAVTLFAAMGDAGKGLICLDLALKVASKNNLLASAFGKEVMDHGKVVVISAEDDAGEVHRRIQNLGQPEQDLYIVPLPNAGGILPLVEEKRNEGIRVTAGYVHLKQQLMAMDNLKLIIIDPLASFIMADINADPACAAYVTGTLAALAQETGAAVIVPHHMTKTKTNISTPEEARSLVRGSTALVDGVRCCYVLWQAIQSETNKICAAIGETASRNKVFYGCVVKSNGPADREIKTYIRNQIGLLEVRDILSQKVQADKNSNLDLMAKVIAWSAEAGHPFTVTRGNGVYDNRDRLPKQLRHLGRKELDNLISTLLYAGRIGKYRIKNGTGRAQWLDIDGGVFSQGLGEISQGKAPQWQEQKQV